MSKTLPPQTYGQIRSAQRQAREMRLSDGTPILLRPVAADDKEQLQEGMTRLSEDSRYLRFMSPLRRLPPDLLRYFTEVDYQDHFALGAQALNEDPPLGIGIARYIREPDNPCIAEPAVTVVDDYQGLGLGRLLLQEIMADASNNGITHFRAYLLAENTAMKMLFAKCGAHFSYKEDGVISAQFPINPDAS